MIDTLLIGPLARLGDLVDADQRKPRTLAGSGLVLPSSVILIALNLAQIANLVGELRSALVDQSIVPNHDPLNDSLENHRPNVSKGRNPAPEDGFGILPSQSVALLVLGERYQQPAELILNLKIDRTTRRKIFFWGFLSLKKKRILFHAHDSKQCCCLDGEGAHPP